MTQIANAAVIDTTRVYGVTIDGINKLSATVTSLSKLCMKPTTRIVFDEWVPATNYQDAVNQIHNVSFIMGELCDSYYTKRYSLQQYTDKTNEYVNLLGSKVDIWEIGNEVNGEWCGVISDVVAKINAAYNIVKAKNYKTELTLYYSKGCCVAKNEMFYWVNKNLSTTMKNGLDYVLISYYEDDCSNLQPNWQQVFDSLHAIFPNSKIGMGECGTTKSTNKAAFINKYYKMNITTPKYVGGYFWWYYRQDCSPYTKALWNTLNTALLGCNPNGPSAIEINENNAASLDNYPNPFNPVTKINFEIPIQGLVTLKVYDLTGKEVANLVNEEKSAGSYSIEFNGANFSSGVYFYRLTAGNIVITKKMTLIK